MQVGDYVRTKGYIAKIDSCTCWKAKNQWYISYKLPNGSEYASTVTDEFKISPNIIDLIEVGDYVNDEKIVGIGCLTNGPEKGTKTIDYYIAPNTVYYFKNENIKSIVTKEQFESVEYKVGVDKE